MALADTSRLPGTATGVVKVVAQGRMPAEVVGELMDVLADEPRVVQVDLSGMTPSGSPVAEEFAPVGRYLASWHGTVVTVHVPDAAVGASLLSAAFAHRMLIHTSWEAGASEARRLLPPLQQSRLQLDPLPTAPGSARTFVDQQMQQWGLSQLIEPATQVVSEFVTNAVVHAPATLDLTLSRVDGRVRVALRDHEAGALGAEGRELPEYPLSGRGLQLVSAFVHGWGVIPARDGGQTVWAVLDAAGASPSEAADAADPHGRATGRHRRDSALDQVPDDSEGGADTPPGRHRSDAAVDDTHTGAPARG
jgi:anti-sigma regulatory factor (Ser/Thr protein kinase)